MLFPPCRSFVSQVAALLLAVSYFSLPSLFADQPVAIKNPGFEEGLEGWVASKADGAGGLSLATSGSARSGTKGLRVKQDAGGPGSWLQSSKSAIEAETAYRLSFWARCSEESGVGVWVQFFDATGQNLATPEQLVISVPRNSKDWVNCHLDVKSPVNAASMTCAVHCYSKTACLADFDDFAITVASVEQSAAAAPSARPARPPLPEADAARVKEIAALLEPVPHGVGPSLDNRAPWEALGAKTEFRDQTLARAEKFLNEAIPEVDRLYAESVRTGDRKADELVTRRRFRLVTFVLAEGIENRGRFLPAIDKELIAICGETSWILSGHVKFIRSNDLGTAMTAWNLSTAVTMLGNRLSSETRKLVHDEVMKRVIYPFLDQVHGKVTPSEFWRDNPNNWNAVVHGGIVGAALALDESIQERAEIVANAEKYTEFYIKGFPADGYSTEGMGYWKYGFGHYVMLSEAVLAATNGKVNLYAKSAIRLVAQFPRRFEMVPAIYPAYSDSLFMEEPSRWLFHIIDRRYGLGDQSERSVVLDGMFSSFLYAYGINMAFDSSAPPLATDGAPVVRGQRLRDWFEQSQVLVGRLPAGQDGLTVSMKGGDNGTSHGHDDLGSYVVTFGRQPLVVDPGSTTYDGNTFGPHRYENQVINSYGHSVPKVAGQLQGNGSACLATVAAKQFTDQADSVTLDLTKGYKVPSLSSLVRRMDYSRANRGMVTINDQAKFSTPQAFGTAVVTFGEPKEEKPGVWTISQAGQKIKVEIEAGGLPFVVTDEPLRDAARAGKLHRLGIDLKDPAIQASVTVKITPAN